MANTMYLLGMDDSATQKTFVGCMRPACQYLDHAVLV